MTYRERNQDRFIDEQEEEEEFFSQLAEIVFKIGQWCLELYGHEDKLLTSPEQMLYNSTLESMLAKAFDLLDQERPAIGRHIVEFLSFWLQALKKKPALTEVDQ